MLCPAMIARTSFKSMPASPSRESKNASSVIRIVSRVDHATRVISFRIRLNMSAGIRASKDAALAAMSYSPRSAPTLLYMFDVSILFHFERAERPASNPSRNPSSVSPRGVLIDIPVMATRSVLGKIHLHDAEHADGVIFHDLSEA